MQGLDKLGLAYIDGEWRTPHGQVQFPFTDPATEQVLGQVTLCDEADVDTAVAAATRAFETFAFTPKADRLALLNRILELSKERLEDLAQAMRQEMGAPITMAREMQADAAVGHLEGFVAALEALDERETLPNGEVLLHEPIGVCGLITPWNWPINQITLKVLPAIATGCTCILQPSEFTPLSAAVYMDLLHEAGVRPGVVNLLQGDGPTVGAAMSRHPDIHMMSFTGSTRAGTAVTIDAAPTVKRVVLELGGKSPNLIFADCDLEPRVRGAVADCFLNTGQSCDAPTRMLVERSVYDQTVEIARDAAETTAVGAPSEEGGHLGPLFDNIQYDRVKALIEKGIEEGARLVAGGPGRPEGFNRGWYVRPTVFADVTPEMTIYKQEIFGPVLSISAFDTEDEAIAMANDTDYGLAAYLQTGNPERAERVAARLRAGAVHINGGYYQYGSPFGGYKQSGNGREGGSHGLADFLELKVLHYG